MKIALWIVGGLVGLAILSWLARGPERKLMRGIQQARDERKASGAPQCPDCKHYIVNEQKDHAWNCPMNPANPESKLSRAQTTITAVHRAANPDLYED